MKILLVSSVESPHQIPFARELVSLVGEQNFRFCATEALGIDRVSLGWKQRYQESWILRAGENEADRQIFEQWWDDADIVLCGERRFSRMNDRLSKGKLCFYTSERWWKPPLGMARLFWPNFLKMFFEFRKVAKHPLFHYLPIGPFASNDILKLISIDRRIWSWGYFTQPPLLATSYRQNGCLRILWVGRMLGLKRLNTLIIALSEIARTNSNFKLTLVGEGPERARLVKMAEKYLDVKTYEFLPPVSADKVTELMSQHCVYVLASSSYEGWGAVVNEAMSCGCAVIASDTCGSAASMIVDRVNGLLFRSGNWRELANQLESLAKDAELRQSLGDAAISSMNELWSPRIAAERFYNVCDALLNERKIPEYIFGPMSTAHTTPRRL